MVGVRKKISRWVHSNHLADNAVGRAENDIASIFATDEFGRKYRAR